MIVAIPSVFSNEIVLPAAVAPTAVAPVICIRNVSVDSSTVLSTVSTLKVVVVRPFEIVAEGV